MGSGCVLWVLCRSGVSVALQFEAIGGDCEGVDGTVFVGINLGVGVDTVFVFVATTLPVALRRAVNVICNCRGFFEAES